ncbi:uncharacterized protein [Ptychodera flava]|uniref:uncharacterized protein n=1 Tax=Ptychodera flava TaxID=63121 RepID=UPI00396A9AD4
MFGSGSSDSEDEDIKRHGAVEWNRIREARQKEGFRDGIAKGEEETLQQGFDDGYQQHITAHVKISYLKGVLSALSTYHELQDGKYLDEDTLKEIKTLQDDISVYEADYSQGSATSDETKPDASRGLPQSWNETECAETDKYERVADAKEDDQQDSMAGKGTDVGGGGDIAGSVTQQEMTSQKIVQEQPVEGATAQTKSSSAYDDIYKRCCRIHRIVLGKDLVISIPGGS